MEKTNGPKMCRIPDCTGEGRNVGLCRAHYARERAARKREGLYPGFGWEDGLILVAQGVTGPPAISEGMLRNRANKSARAAESTEKNLFSDAPVCFAPVAPVEQSPRVDLETKIADLESEVQFLEEKLDAKTVALKARLERWAREADREAKAAAELARKATEARDREVYLRSLIEDFSDVLKVEPGDR